MLGVCLPPGTNRSGRCREVTFSATRTQRDRVAAVLVSGYPFPDAPQLSPNSPWTSLNVSMWVPWLIEFRHQQLQHKSTPPTIPFLAVDPAIQLQAGTQLGEAIASSAVATELARAWHALTESDRRQLRDASARLGQAQYPSSDDNTGSEDFRHLAWSDTELDAALRSLTGRAQEFTTALTHADRLIQQAAYLFSQLTTRGPIRRIGNVTEIQQLAGAAGWHTIRSEEDTLLSPIRCRRSDNPPGPGSRNPPAGWSVV